jgi:hypothetical protein
MTWHAAQIKFPEPVQIRAVSAAAAAAGPSAPGGRSLLRAFAKDVFSPSAARFVQLIGPAAEVGQQLHALPIVEVRALEAHLLEIFLAS